MAARHRTNPLALAVLISLYERPMHPYEVATTLRQRNKHESVRLNYGSLYGVVESLERRGLIVASETGRAGRRPERTVYELTEAGSIEMHDWLTDLVARPVKDYPSFEAALSFLPALPPEDVAALLEERAQRLTFELAQAAASRELLEKQRLPRLFWVEDEFRSVLRMAELQFVEQLAREIRAGTLEGVAWWREIHRRGRDGAEVPFPWEVAHAEHDHDRGHGRGGGHGSPRTTGPRTTTGTKTAAPTHSTRRTHEKGTPT